jgi:hypothetical protein
MKPSAFSYLVMWRFLTSTAYLGPVSQMRVLDTLVKAGRLRRPRLAREAAEAAIRKAAKP